MDKMFSRKQRLIDLYKNEEHELMKEFEEMKKHEQLQEFERQADMIKQYQKESQEIHDNTVKRSEQMRINGSNQVIKEKMSLEAAKTAN
jgi:D-hexose-6-phosphate mutarotase